MNNTTYLKQQYQKISKKLHKAFTTGRFYEYTQYKQQQLLDRFSNYSLQLRKLGVAVAVGASIGMATPVQAQTPFIKQTGMDNLLNNADSMRGSELDFVDLDGDGDFDIVSNFYVYSYNSVNSSYDFGWHTHYYENTGSSTSPAFTKRNNLFSYTDTIQNLSFVDIDGDGDLDCFASKSETYTGYTGKRCVYHENVGSSNNPIFMERPDSLNPLDTLNKLTAPDYYFWGNVSSYDLAFVDLDKDGDMDVFFSSKASINSSRPKYTYFRNDGTSSLPLFIDTVNHSPIEGINTPERINFYDWDNDGDMDITLGRNYYENLGVTQNTININIFPFLNNTPLRSLNMSDIVIGTEIVDIDGDGDMDFYGYMTLRSGYPDFVDTITFYENRTIVLDLPKIEEQKLSISVFPNPTTGFIQLEKPLTGTLEVFNALGQVLQTAVLEEQQQISLGQLDNGSYIIKIQTAAGILNEKIILKK